MANFNRVILMGNVTRDIELKYTGNQLAVTEMGLAVHDRVKRNEEWVDDTTFVDVTLWGRTAEVAAQYLSKGSPVFVEGRLKFDTWEKDGQKRSKLRVVGERIQLLTRREGGGARSGSPSAVNERHDDVEHASSSADYAGPPSDDVPF